MPEDIKRSILSRLYHLGRYMRQLGEAGSGIEELTMHQMQALFFIRRRQPVRMRELAEELCISPGSASLLADRLVEAGWLVRTHDAEDRRSVCLELADEAGRKLGRLMKRRMEQAARMLDALGPDDLEQLDRILALLHHPLAKGEGSEGEAGKPCKPSA